MCTVGLLPGLCSSSADWKWKARVWRLVRGDDQVREEEEEEEGEEVLVVVGEGAVFARDNVF